MSKKASFFLGTNSGDGFYSLFSDITRYDGNWRTYVIKGGPGTGKSGLMKKIADKADILGTPCERIWCSSDPASLDAVVLPEKKVAICDGTAPHIVEPQFAGAVEQIINLGEFWDSKALKLNSTKIMKLCSKNGSCHKKVSRLLGAIKELEYDTESMTEDYLDYNKLAAFANEICLKIPKKTDGSAVNISNRFLSGITPDGITTFYSTVRALCDSVMIISDNYNTVSSKIIDIVYKHAIDCGYSVILCRDLIFTDRISHVIIPELSFGLVTSSPICNFKFKADKKVSVSRFFKRGLEAEFGRELEFNREISEMLFSCCTETLKKAKDIHDDLEELYIKNMDFEAVDGLTSRLIKKIF